jgi:tetratricopeptide (TPR) repeat protein
MVPQAADGFVPRPETRQSLASALVPGATVMLVSARAEALAATAATAAPAYATPGSTARNADWRDPSGKTQLAIEAALSLWEHGDVEVLVWVTATSAASVMSAYAEAAETEGQPSGGAEAAAARFAGWLRETTRPWLVVLDDLTPGAVPDRLWPGGPAGRVLVTATTSGALPGTGEGPRVIPVGSFSRREALTYLMGRLKADVEQRQGAADLVSELDGEPLALAQASAVIATSDLSCRDYLELLDGARKNVIGDDTSAASITWALSVQHADLLAPGAQPALVRAALLDGHGAPATLFGDTVSGYPSHLPAELEALEQAALLVIDRSVTPPLIRMNRIVQAAVLAALPGSMLPTAAEAAAAALVQAWPGSEQPEWLRRCFRSNAERLSHVAGDGLWHRDHVHELLLRAGCSLDAARLTNVAVEYWEELASLSEQRLGPEHPGTLEIRERLARAQLPAGRTRESIGWFVRIRSDRARKLGPYHAATAEASHDLGRALLAAGRPGDAVGVLTDTIGGYERARGLASIEVLTAREDLAAAQRAAGQLAEAIVAYRRVLADRERLHGGRHPDTMAACRMLAETYLAAGQAKPAISHYKRLLADSERALGPAHQDTIAVRCALAAADYGAGRMAAAIQHYERAREDYTRALGPDHESTLRTSVNLAHAYCAAGRVTDATNLLRDTARRCELTRPAADPLTQAVRDSLSSIS